MLQTLLGRKKYEKAMADEHPLRTEYGEILRISWYSGPNAGKYGPEKLRIRTLFTQCTWRVQNYVYTELAARRCLCKKGVPENLTFNL